MNVPEKEFVAKGKKFFSLQDAGGIGFVVGGNHNDAIVVDIYFDGKATGQSLVLSPQGAIKLGHALAVVAEFGSPEEKDSAKG